ncbi:MAG: hypothetical protein EA379_10795 [Phycisphaerales bacterium]|nr:MAG: hypothetical protein EA379_10795 [Phycisphaerales bacterium]
MTRPWSDHELERYHDADLPAADRDALSADLMRDAALRERLSHIRELDGYARAALLDDAPLPRRAGPAGPRARFALGALGVAACAALAFGAFTAIRALVPTTGPASEHSTLALTPPEPPAPPAPRPLAAGDAVAKAEAREGLLLVVTNVARTEPAPVVAQAGPTLGERIDERMRRGDAAGAIGLLAEADGAVLASALTALGDRVHSGEAARELLATLPVAQQVEACRAWVERPSLRPIAFEWLASLERAADDDARESARALRRDLAQRPELRAWLLSYAAR